MNPRWLFIAGLVAGAVLADVSRPARQVYQPPVTEESCSTDAECETACYAKLPPNRPAGECEVEL